MAAYDRLKPAHIVFDADGRPRAPDFDDVYHARIGATAQAQAVFLAGNGLPERWRGRAHFTMAENGFGLGQNFLATWAAWRADPQRCGQLHYVGVEGHPAHVDDLAQALAPSPTPDLAQALIQVWPPMLAGWHGLDLDGGRVRLLLAFGEAAQVWRELRLRADAFFLDGFAPDRNPAMWAPPLLQAMGRRAAAGATAATWSAARAVRDGLRSAGFAVQTGPAVGPKRETLRAVFDPPASMHRAPPTAPPGEVLVLGAGLAGAWAAHELAAIGCSVRVLDRHARPAQEASGNAAGLFHGVVMADDGAHARTLRAAALHAARVLPGWMAAGVPGQAGGLLRLAGAGDTAGDLQVLIDRHALPATYVQAQDAAQASSRAGLTLDRAAWWYPGGGWIAPSALTARLLEGVPFEGGVDVARIAHIDGRWTLFDADDHIVASTTTLVLANAAEAARLAPWAGWPMGRSRGQVSLWRTASPDAPRPHVPVAGGGYLIAMPDGGLLTGATSQPGDDDPIERTDDHDFNRTRLHKLSGWQAPTPDAGRVGWRAQVPDRLPLVGAVPAQAATRATRLDRVERAPGLFVLSALGSRGLTWGPMAARLLASQVGGRPWPLEASLANVLDPARWQVRMARRALGQNVEG
ncbi:MAG: FAD-dependent 5-carboxymethylaminomethyl-2-thiouridine(34) oxidoreductase MnmC [Burkholderiaceae bacterium]|nr:FAD-dependent 5-carboxymethylaminomethyl-2-thiouridine(34) oxidoreductase MnmC [Burkholderiaceae bacterium]